MYCTNCTILSILFHIVYQKIFEFYWHQYCKQYWQQYWLGLIIEYAIVHNLNIVWYCCQYLCSYCGKIVNIVFHIVFHIVNIVILSILYKFQYIVILFHICSIVSYWRVVPAPKWLLLPRLLLQRLPVKFSFQEPVSPTALFNATLWNHIQRYAMKSCRNIHLIATTATATISLRLPLHCQLQDHPAFFPHLLLEACRQAMIGHASL